MNQIKIYLLLSILINFVMICCGYLVGQIDGDFVDGMRIEINMHFIGSPDKYLMQAIDTKQNRFSIKTSKTFSQYNKTLIIDFNGLLATLNAGRINEYRRYHDGGEMFQLWITFEFKQNNLYYEYHESILLLLSNVSNSNNNDNKNINNQINSSSKSSDWPNDGDLHKLINKTRIWFGYSNNIDQYNQIIIIGCIDWLFVGNNNENIKLEKKGNIDNFYIDCLRNNEVIESICNQYGSCRNETSSRSYHHILDCGSSLINTAQYCYQDLSNNNMDLHRSYRRIGYKSQSVIVNLSWITQQSINQCLLEINTRNNSLIEIYLNSLNQIMLEIKHDKSINWSKHILYEISSNQIHVLKIEFNKYTSIFKVSNGDFIKTLILSQWRTIELINVGRNFKRNSCQPLATKFDFQYNCKQFQPVNQSNVILEYKSSNVFTWIIFLIIIIAILCLILIYFILMLEKMKKQKENVPKSTLNIYEEPIEMTN